MDERDGYYFHRSFWESIELMNAKDQLAIFKAITVFALDGTDPEKLTSNQKAAWVLIRPVLAKGRNKAANGKKGGSKKEANGKQNKSKPKSASDLPLSDKGLGSNSNELRLGTRDEGVNDDAEATPPNDGSLFTAFWNAYPESAKRRREDAWNAWKQLNPDETEAARIMDHLNAWKLSQRWIDDGGGFIPNAENFLDPDRGYMKNKPAPAKQSHNWTNNAERQPDQYEIEAIQRVLNENFDDLPPLEEEQEEEI